ncbi:Dam family site-specific DNA-(adenine-N6)-methyltransferase [Aeromonas cavernicola]|uniref:Site-specific DNA-methyltransferase (adenine-specific) n=1 Tax=Aeromonas cavernicola TaxID=1006623 RepID=A0A2H9U9L9_9GAMM|nr:Dam family site-specific DNA-(adenine-N6)-methyltransferase [Aeromonas cavernicola]PJG60718.1 DNA adenine methylase [Aeromonas cavernicola]
MKKTRAFLKWAGGKYSLVEEISERLPAGRVLLEPFVGAGSVFLNTDYEAYVLNDINPDLIGLYNHLKLAPDHFISEAHKLFVAECNSKATYYRLRTQFNHADSSFERALLFLYLNRHGFNGLCRYNKKGGFNVPFGSYKKPYFPEKELWIFAEKAQKATFICESYADAIARAEDDWVIYCDPPYAPLSNTASFTSYAAGGFTLDDQAILARLARHAANHKNVPVLISNHDIELTRELYREANLDKLFVKRTISSNGGTRNKVAELLALYPAKAAV